MCMSLFSAIVCLSFGRFNLFALICTHALWWDLRAFSFSAAILDESSDPVLAFGVWHYRLGGSFVFQEIETVKIHTCIRYCVGV